MNKACVEIAKNFVYTILSNNGDATADGVAEMFEIKSGNKEVLLEHLKAISNIISKAIEELEKENE